MAVNIGLVVHDKINLQNSVDLAAYYAAQRQAEMLNVVAHTNYQIRQSWKLLTWRYYVLGTMGMGEDHSNRFSPHPSRANANYPVSDDSIWPVLRDTKTPVMCVTYQPNWKSAGGNDNLCKNVDFRVTNIKIPKVIAPFSPINLVFEGLAKKLQQKIADTCTAYAGHNWLFASLAYVSFMFDQANRKELIRALARNMSRPMVEMVDLDGESVFEGAKKTFTKNLTGTNRESNPEFEMFNSLAGLKPSDWLNDIDVIFTMMYSDIISSASGCNSDNKQLNVKPNDQSWASLVNTTQNEQNLNYLLEHSQMAASIVVGDARRLSMGVEKNPWYMAYVGVKAKSRPRQLFPPFGEPVVFEAKAFAQPFGGRIGPWYGTAWSRGAQSSEGDRLQLSPEKLLAGGVMNSDKPENLMPQYSKYPGDKLGLTSVLAQNALVNQRDIEVSLADYTGIYDAFGDESANDVLAFNEGAPRRNIREYEIAAVAPDLFDITYYSIQPNFGTRYLTRLLDNVDKLKIPASGYPRGDLGSRDPNGSGFSVQDQIAVANGLPVKVGPSKDVPPRALQKPDAFWFVRDRKHLLTDWVHNDTYGKYFAFPIGRFGQCKEFDDDYKLRAPGSCVDEGGRTGFSVKIISSDILREELPLGGPGQSAGLIMNPPPEGW